MQWIPTINSLPVEKQVAIVEILADLNAYDPDSPEVARMLQVMDADGLACKLASDVLEPSEKARYYSLA